MMGRAFDGSKSVSMGAVDFALKVGHFQFEVPLLWFTPQARSICCWSPMDPHCQTIPFSLHQNVKFVKEDRAIIIMVEKEIPIHFSSIIPFIDKQDVKEDSKYLSF